MITFQILTQMGQPATNLSYPDEASAIEVAKAITKATSTILRVMKIEMVYETVAVPRPMLFKPGN